MFVAVLVRMDKHCFFFFSPPWNKALSTSCEHCWLPLEILTVNPFYESVACFVDCTQSLLFLSFSLHNSSLQISSLELAAPCRFLFFIYKDTFYWIWVHFSIQNCLILTSFTWLYLHRFYTQIISHSRIMDLHITIRQLTTQFNLLRYSKIYSYRMWYIYNPV